MNQTGASTFVSAVEQNRGQFTQREAANSPLFAITSDRDRLQDVESSVAPTGVEGLVLEELARILQSRIFSLSARMKRFLRFAVETTLEGRADCLKEYVIGTEVYDRTPPYEPSQDSIVRTEARRLRGKLKEYYESEGRMDPLIISFRTGSYIPVFTPREQLNADRPQTYPSVESISAELPEVLIVVVRLGDECGGTLAKDCARAISEGIALQLNRRAIHKSLAEIPLPTPHLALVNDPDPR